MKLIGALRIDRGRVVDAKRSPTRGLRWRNAPRPSRRRNGPPRGVARRRNRVGAETVSAACHDCQGTLEPRVERDSNPLHPRWGAWCARCGGWWPDEDDGTPTVLDRPAPYRLSDDPLTITPTGAGDRSAPAGSSLVSVGH